jgi:starch phosphorylase
MNISGAGVFSADRSIMDYAENIWHTKPVDFKENNSTPAKKSNTAKKKSKKK